MGYIYKITNNKNGKIYIGKTDLPEPIQRWKEHSHDYKTKRCEKRPLYDAMNKYGLENFKFEVIEETDNTEEREKYWINELRTYIGFKDCNGYNATLGGDGKSYLNLDEKEIIQYHIEKAEYCATRTAKYFEIDRKTVIKILKKNNIKFLSIQEWHETLGKTTGVCQLDNVTGELLNIFKSYVDANEYMEKSRSSSVIRMASVGKIKTAYGFKWMKYDDYLKSIASSEDDAFIM